METPCSKTVHLPLFLFSFLFTFTFSQPRYITPRRLSVSHFCWSADLTLFAFITKFVHTHCSPRLLSYKHTLDTRRNVCQLASADRPDGSPRDHSLKPATLLTLFTYYRQCTAYVHSSVKVLALPRLSAKLVLLA